MNARRWLLRIAVALALTVLVGVVALRVLLPQLDRLQPQVETALGRYLGMTVRAEHIELGWWGWQPALQVERLRLTPIEPGAGALSLAHGELKLDLLGSLRERRPLISDLRLHAAELALNYPPALPEVDASGGRLKTLLAALYTLKRLSLVIDRLSLRDGHGTVFSARVEARLSGGPERQLQLSLQTPGFASFGRLRLQAQLDGTIAQPALRFFLRAGDDAPLDVDLWGHWRPTGFKLQGRVWLAGADAERWRLEFDGGEHGGSRRRWLGRLSQFAADGERLRYSPLSLGIGGTATDPELTLVANRLRLRPLLGALGPWLGESWRRRLTGVAPDAALDELVLRWRPRAGPAGRWALVTQLREGKFGVKTSGFIDQLAGGDRGAALRPEPDLIVADIAGRLELSPDRGRLLIDGPLALGGAPLRGPLSFERLAGELRWRRGERGWLLSSDALQLANADLAARLAGSLSLQAGRSPLLDLRVGLSRLELAALHRYLPHGLRPKLRDWLDSALLEGTVEAASAGFYGRLARFPFDDGDGWFDAELLLDNTRFHFHPDWPALSDLDASVRFHNRELRVHARRGRFAGLALHPTRAQIIDLAAPRLLLDGALDGPLADMLALVSSTPLAPALGRPLAGIEAHGEAGLELELALPLRRPEPAPGPAPLAVDGALELRDNRIELARAGVVAESVVGRVDFSEREFATVSGPLGLRLFGREASLDIRRPAAAQSVSLALEGRYRAEELAAGLGLAPSLTAPATGESLYQVKLELPLASGAAPSLQLYSDLYGTIVTAPLQTFAKSAEQRRPLRLQAVFDDTETLLLNAHYAPDLNAALRLARTGQRFKLERGAVVFGGEAELPEHSGLAIEGELPRLELSALGAANGAGFELARARLRVRRLELAGMELRDSRLALERDTDGASLWRVAAAGSRGRLRLPAPEAADRSLELAFERLSLYPRAGQKPAPEAGLAFEPRRLPPARLRIDELRWRDRPLGALSAELRVDQQGLVLQDLRLDADTYRLQAEASWRRDGERDHSRLRARFTAAAMAEPLAALGYQAPLSGSDLQARLQLAWPGMPQRPNPAELDGALELRVGQGRLAGVEPGVGRYVGLVNLAALARRLQLDFSDFSTAGFAYDRVDAKLAFANGKALIREFLVTGPSAHIRAEGEFDLLRRRYRQTLTVMPQIGSSLALAGALAGGPAVGAAVLVAERILKPGFDQALSHRYRLSGPWSDPRIEPLAAEPDGRAGTPRGHSRQ